VETTDYADYTDEKSGEISRGGEFEKSPFGRGLRRELSRTIEGWVKNKTCPRVNGESLDLVF
jgi:hypothetical protein